MKKVSRFIISFSEAPFLMSDGLMVNDFLEISEQLMCRLLNKHYFGPKISNFVVKFYSEKTIPQPLIAENLYTYHPGCYIFCNGRLNFDSIRSLSYNDRTRYIWDQLFEIIDNAATYWKKDKLKAAILLAYQEGIAIDLDPSNKLIQQGKPIPAVPFP